MSLIKGFSKGTLCIGLAPTQLTYAVRNGPTFLTKGAYRQTLENDEADWRPLVGALQVHLRKSDRPMRNLSTIVVLSSRWCRLMVVPWSDALLQDAKKDRFLQMQYTALYGDDAQNWVLTTDDAAYGQPRLVCGIERELLLALQGLGFTNKFERRTIEPFISYAWRGVAAVMGTDIKAIAVIEKDWLTLCRIVKGRIVALQSQACDHAWSVELVRAWQRWTLRFPELTTITQVAVLNVTGEAMDGELPPLFTYVTLPPNELEPAYHFITCDRGL